jgi:hypothetical protein
LFAVSKAQSAISAEDAMKCSRSVIMSASIVVPLMVAAVAACASDDSRMAEFVERDSAGIRITENGRNARIETWSVTAEPLLEIGEDDGDSTHLLFRVTGAAGAGSDRIVIANGAPPMLRWFDRDGRFLHGTGRTGGGPGEFQGLEGGTGNIWALWPVGPDSVATWEHPPRRMQVFGPDGEFVRSVILTLPNDLTPGAYPSIVGRLGDDGFVAFLSIFEEPRNTSSTWRDTLTYARWLDDGSFADTVARLPGFEAFTSEFMGRRTRGRPPFAKPPAAWTDGSRFYYGSADRFEVSVYDTSGALQTLIRRDAPRRSLGDAVIASYVEERMRDAPPDPEVRRAWETSLTSSPYPDSLPAYRRIRVDRVGALWVQDYDLPTEQDVAWTVFDPTGRWIATLKVPRAWQIQDIGADYVLVLARNELDVEIVQLYGLNRGAAGGEPH